MIDNRVSSAAKRPGHVTLDLHRPRLTLQVVQRSCADRVFKFAKWQKSISSYGMQFDTAAGRPTLGLGRWAGRNTICVSLEGSCGIKRSPSPEVWADLAVTSPTTCDRVAI